VLSRQHVVKDNDFAKLGETGNDSFYSDMYVVADAEKHRVGVDDTHSDLTYFLYSLSEYFKPERSGVSRLCKCNVGT
jgi:hypothetical protein